jgi:RNA polymerase sigma factor (sigma-70 family)
MNTEDKMKVCRKLAHSFRRHELTDDLIQEGMIAMLEAEERGYDGLAGDFVMLAKKRMQDFISLCQGPLSIPPSSETRENAKAIRNGSETPVTEYMTEDTYNSLKTALGASTALLEGDEVMYEGNTEEYIWVQQVEDLMREKLSEKDFQIFQMRFGPEEFTQVEVAKALDMSERNVRLREHTIQKKLSRLK